MIRFWIYRIREGQTTALEEIPKYWREDVRKEMERLHIKFK